MKQQKISSITELKHGMKVHCREGYAVCSIEISAETSFFLNKRGLWGVNCDICGSRHLLDKAEIYVNEVTGK